MPAPKPDPRLTRWRVSVTRAGQIISEITLTGADLLDRFPQTSLLFGIGAEVGQWQDHDDEIEIAYLGTTNPTEQ